jgi:hypothetical protein
MTDVTYSVVSEGGQELCSGVSTRDIGRVAQSHADRLDETVTVSGGGESWEVEPSGNEDLVVLESMPEQHRASHRAARNFGVYPANGAERYVMPRVEAEEVVESDEDGYDRVVRDATPADVERYGTEARPDGW